MSARSRSGTFLHNNFPTVRAGLSSARSAANQLLTKAATAFHHSGYGGQSGFFGMMGGAWNWLQSLLTGSTYDYRRKAGNLWENSVVGIALNFLQRTYPEAPLCVERLKSGRWQQSFEHEVLELLACPNEFWDDSQLWDATLLSWIASGNAYWIKVRSNAGKVVELWWVPWWMIEPRWSSDGSEYITHYEYRVEGRSYSYLPEDVIHFRNGVDPANTRKGMTDLNSSLREICGDNEASVYHAALLSNMGVPGIIFSPKDDKSTEVTDDDAEQLKRNFKDKYSGKRVGEPLVLFNSWDIHNPAHSPDTLALDKLVKFYEARIAAALGIPAVVLGILVGLETSSAKASYRDSLFQAYIACIKPLHRKFNSQLTRQLLGEFDNPKRCRLARDYSEIAVLQEDRNKLYARLTQASGGPWMTPNEAREEAKKPAHPGEGMDEIRQPGAALNVEEDDEDDEGTGDEDEKERNKSLRAKVAKSWQKALR
jgi:HK97 family phage portal protein